jgi:flavin reductase (DIM6/NTAB) family NADH-FMN oxidoreductase RutF
MIFSPARRVRGNTTKHTLDNAALTREVVINVVNYSMVQQMSLASSEYAQGINEFVKAGFTELQSEKVRPPRVKESPVAFECKVNEIVPLGADGGAGNLVICEVVHIHLDEAILGADDRIDPYKLDSVARMGSNWYCRAQGEAIFEIPKPLTSIGIGIDNIPEPIRLSKLLTGNDLGQLGNVENLPDSRQIAEARQRADVSAILNEPQWSKKQKTEKLFELAGGYLSARDTTMAWCILLVALEPFD